MYFFTVDEDNKQLTYAHNTACNAGIGQMIDQSDKSIGLYNYANFSLVEELGNQDIVDEYLTEIRKLGFTFDWKVMSAEEVKKVGHKQVIENYPAAKYLRIYFPRIKGNNYGNVFLGITIIRYLWYSYCCNWMGKFPNLFLKFVKKYPKMKTWDCFHLVNVFVNDKVMNKQLFKDKRTEYSHGAGPSVMGSYQMYISSPDSLKKLFDKPSATSRAGFSINKYFDSLDSVPEKEVKEKYKSHLAFLGELV